MRYKNYFKCKVVGEKHSSDPHFMEKFHKFVARVTDAQLTRVIPVFIWTSDMHVKVLPAALNGNEKKCDDDDHVEYCFVHGNEEMKINELLVVAV